MKQKHSFPTTRGLMFMLLCSWLGAFSEQSQASSPHISVTPTHLEVGNFVFKLDSHPVESGIAVHITVSFKDGIAPKHAKGGVGRIIRTEYPNGSYSISGAAVPEITPKITKGDKGWMIDFIASKELLHQPDLNFTFSVFAFDNEGHPVPSVVLYEMKLIDFVKL
jgi:hypothetical protein